MRNILSYGRLLVDLFSIKLMVWMFGGQFGGQLLDSHLFFYHRYTELADYHRANGRSHKADRLEALAELHYQAAPGDDDHPPETAAMAMPVPRPMIDTNAVSTRRLPRSGIEESGWLPTEG
jgi:hypothetical protein